MQDRKYEGEIRFKNLLPWRAPWAGHSRTSSDTEMRRTILRWLENDLRGKVEKSIRPFLSGYFSKNVGSAIARLPAIEVFTLKGVPEELTAFTEWSKTARAWLESFGFRLVFNVYSDERSIFAFPDRWNSKEGSPYRLVILWDSYLKSVSTDGFNGDEMRAITHSTTYTLRPFAMIITLHEFLNSIQKNVSTLRKITFGAIKRQKKLLGRYIKLNSTVQRESILLERISMEFRQQRRLIERSLTSVSEFKEFIPAAKCQQKSFSEIALDGLKNRIQFLREQVGHIKHSFSDFLTLQNMRAVYRLQWLVLGLSIIATLAALFSAIASWPNIKEFLKDIFGIQF